MKPTWQNPAAYVRISSDKQDSARQRESIERFAGRTGISIGHWITDDEGRNPRDRAEKRAGFQRLLKMVQVGLVDCIVVDSQDRFGTKDAYEYGKFIDLLRSHGCELWDSGGRCLSANDDATVISAVVAAQTSAREQREKAHRNVTAKMRKAKEGEYLGGYPAYGCDVVCFGPDGKEKWRTVYDGHYKRRKIWPDGRWEQFDGKDNAPRKDPLDTLRQRPTIEVDRIKAVKQIFEWYAKEAISPKQIADRLNDFGVPCLYAPQWHKITVRDMLSNPTYIGLPAWNRRGGSRFVEFSEGQVREVARTNGQVKAGRRRSSSDFIQPDKPQFKPIISASIWDKVQDKLGASSTKRAAVPRRAPSTAELWLRPFLVCWKCKKQMRATRGESTAYLEPSYYCGTYGTYGQKNPTGCRCHRVYHDLLERIVLDYVEKTAPQVRQLLEASESGNTELAKPLLGKLTETGQAYHGVACDLISFLEDNASPRELSKLFKAGRSLDEIYGLVYERLRPGLEKKIAAKEAELDKMLDGFRSLSPKLKQRANAKMEQLQAEIDALNRELDDLRVPYTVLRDELKARRDGLDRALHALRSDGTGRQKTEALGQVVDRIVCHFRYTNRDGTPTRKKSFLDQVEIVPVSGEAITLRSEAWPDSG